MTDTLKPTVIRVRGAQSKKKQQNSKRSSKVWFDKASDPALRDEITETLRSRLRVVAILILSAFVLFFIRGMIRHETVLQVLRLVVMVVAIVCLVLTRPTARMSHFYLRVIEALIFSVVVLQMIAFQVIQTQMAIDSGDDTAVVAHSLFALLTWSILVMSYGMFIPNTWQRALFFIFPVTIIPTALTLLLASDIEAVSEYIYLGFLLSVTAGIASLLGTHFVNAMHRDAFEARQYGQYKLKERLGVGGMGEVYLAEHRMLKRPSAIKLINPETYSDPEAVHRFESEVQATATLSHWNTVDIFDYGRTNDGVFYFVMEYLPGMDLEKIVARHGPMPPARAVHFLSQICAALEEAHSVDLIHRDIKPSNVIASVRGGLYDVAKLVDFGLVQHTQKAGNSSDGSNQIAGSPMFMSPEQFNSPETVDQRSDLYSLGVTAYFLLSGHYPFQKRQTVNIQRTDAEFSPVSLSSRIETDTYLESVVMRCIEKNPEHRFQSAFDVRMALKNCSEFGKWTSKLARSWWEEKR